MGEFNRLYVAHARESLKAGKTPKQAAMDFKPGEKLKDCTLTGNGNYETTFRPRSRRERADEPPPAPPQPTGDELDLDPEIEYAFDVEEPMAGRDRCKVQRAMDDVLSTRRSRHRGSALTSPASF